MKSRKPKYKCLEDGYDPEERICAYKKTYREKHKTRLNAESRQYRIDNPEYFKNYRKKN